MNAKYQNLINEIRRGEGDEETQRRAVGAAIDELMREATEIQDLLQELQGINRGIQRGNFLAKQRAAWEASQAKGGD